MICLTFIFWINELWWNLIEYAVDGALQNQQTYFGIPALLQPNDVTLRCYLTPWERLLPAKRMYDPFLIYFKMWYKDWMKSSFSACQCLTKNTSDSVNTHVLHFCPPGLQSYLPAVSLLPLFQGGWVSTAQHLTGKVPLIFLKSINPSSRPVSIAGQHYCSLLRALGKHLLCMLRLATLLTQSF